MSQVLMVPWRGQRDLPEADALLFHAHCIVEGTTCPSCGRDLKECRDAGNAGRFDVETDVCHATAALERWRHGAGKDAPGGTLPYVVLAGESSGGLSQAQMVAAQQAAQSARTNDAPSMTTPSSTAIAARNKEPGSIA